MTLFDDRQQMSDLITQACSAGSRLALAGELFGLSDRPLQRRRSRAKGSVLGGDQRPHAHSPNPSHALRAAERTELLRGANEPRFADIPAARIVPLLADVGCYLASESSFARLLRQAGQGAHRSRSRASKVQRMPTTHITTAPGQVWWWEMTCLSAMVAGRWFCLYPIVDLYGRKVEDREVYKRH